MPTQKLTKRRVDELLAGDKPAFCWDQAPKGFGIKVTPSGVKTFVFQYRLLKGRDQKSKRVSIGRYGSPWTVETARIEALRMSGLVASGIDPGVKQLLNADLLTVEALCALYLEQGLGTKKPSTIATDKGRILRHVIPLIGSNLVKTITKADVQSFHDDVAVGRGIQVDKRTGPRSRTLVTGGKGTAARSMGLLGAIFQFAVESDLLDHNPARGVKRYRDKRRNRYLTPPEITKISAALEKLEGEGKSLAATHIIRLLILTGARRGEIEGLKWKEVDEINRYLSLSDSKTGQKLVRLNDPALLVIRKWRAIIGRSGTYVFASQNGKTPYSGTPKVWKQVCQITGLSDLRMHDLRHTFASTAVEQGVPLHTIGNLLGHHDVATTQRYAHLSDDPIRDANELIGGKLGEALGL